MKGKTGRKAQRIDGVVASIIEKLDKQARPGSEEIEAIWKKTAGEKAARHTRPASLRKKCLVVNVEGSAWLYELTLRKNEILAGLREKLGGDKVNKIQFRIGEI